MWMMDGGCCYWPCHVKVCACATLAGQWWSWTREDAKVRRTRKDLGIENDSGVKTVSKKSVKSKNPPC